MGFTLTINTTSGPFQAGGAATEVSRILFDTARRLPVTTAQTGDVSDVNGKRCGTWEFTEDARVERVRILNSSRMGTVTRGETTLNVRNVLVAWDDGSEPSWHRVADQRPDVTLVNP